MEEHSHPHSHPVSALGIAGWLVLVLVAGGGMWQLHQEIAAMRAAPQSDAALTELKVQGVMLASLKADLEQLRQTPPGTDTTVAPALAEVNTQLAAIAQRLQALETAKTTTPQSAAATAPVRLLLALESKLLRGEAYSAELEALAAASQVKDETEALTALRTFATSGAPTELTLRAELDHILKAPLADSATAEKINSHLSGLITVKRRPVTAQKTPLEFPAEMPITAIHEKITALPEAERAPFADWLNTVATRDKAITATATLQNKLLPLS